MSVQSFTGDGEERFPLLLQMLENEKPSSVCGCQSGHNGNRVSSGVAMVLGRWPNNITAGCISAIFLTTVIIATLLMILTVLVITTLHGNADHRMIIRRETALLEIDTSCDYHEEQNNAIHETKYTPDLNLFGLLKLEIPIPKKRSLENENNLQETDSLKAFFITNNKLLSPYQICSIESAAKAMPNYTFYLITITSNSSKIKEPSDKRIQDLAKKYHNIKTYNFPCYKYFRDSPISGIPENTKFGPSIIAFAARVLTLWRYGGVTLNTNLIAVSNISSDLYPIPHDSTVMVSDREASVMSVSVQCHAFLYEIMNALASLDKSEDTDSVTVSEIMEVALSSFCYNARKRESTRFCKGVAVMPESLFCSQLSETMLPDKSCIWAFRRGIDRHSRQNLCPMAYHTCEFKRHKHTKISSHKRKMRYVI